MRKAFYLCACLFAGSANAALIGFVSNPSSNSSEWATEIATLGGAINANVNFDAMATGALDGNFYSTSDGVTLSTVGDVNNVVFGAGPGQGNTGGSILGEGLHPASNYLADNGQASSLTISFANSVLGVGLDIIDYFNPASGNFNNTLTIEAFTGQNGTGTSLGLFASGEFNFQRNNEYFMGLVSTDGDIGSLVFSDVNSNAGDTTGIDNIVFATSSTTTPVPEPTQLSLIGLGLFGLIFARRNKAK